MALDGAGYESARPSDAVRIDTSLADSPPQIAA